MWDKKLKNRTIKKKLSRWMTVVCSFLLAVGLGLYQSSQSERNLWKKRTAERTGKAFR